MVLAFVIKKYSDYLKIQRLGYHFSELRYSKYIASSEF